MARQAGRTPAINAQAGIDTIAAFVRRALAIYRAGVSSFAPSGERAVDQSVSAALPPMRTAIERTPSISPSRPTSRVCIIDAFLSQQRQTTNLRIQGNGWRQEGIHITSTDHPTSHGLRALAESH